jgi:hypothetical protein
VKEASKRIVFKPDGRPLSVKAHVNMSISDADLTECYVRTVRSFGSGGREISFDNALLDVSNYRRRSTKRGQENSFLLLAYCPTFVHYAFGVVSMRVTVHCVITHRLAGRSQLMKCTRALLMVYREMAGRAGSRPLS